MKIVKHFLMRRFMKPKPSKDIKSKVVGAPALLLYFPALVESDLYQAFLRANFFDQMFK